MTISPADIRAAIDVLRQAQNESDDIDFDLAAELRLACQELGRTNRETISLLETEMLRQCEAGSKEHDGIVYIAVNNRKDIYDHDMIEARVVEMARERAVDENGVVNAAEAARQAAHLMRGAYVAPSTTARKGALEAMGVSDAVSKQTKGRKLHEVDPQG